MHEDSENAGIPLAAEHANKQNAMRDQIAATLKSLWPAPWFGGDRQHQQILDLANAIVAELDLGTPCAATGCRMRQIARRHAESSSDLSD